MHPNIYYLVRRDWATLPPLLKWEASVAQSLREVSRTIRDRVDVIRRSSSQAVETQASVAGILAITYGLAFLMWRQYPERVDSFLSNDIGLSAVGISVFLQAIGVAWISRTTQVEV